MCTQGATGATVHTTQYGQRLTPVIPASAERVVSRSSEWSGCPFPLELRAQLRERPPELCLVGISVRVHYIPFNNCSREVTRRYARGPAGPDLRGQSHDPVPCKNRGDRDVRRGTALRQRALSALANGE